MRQRFKKKKKLPLHDEHTNGTNRCLKKWFERWWCLYARFFSRETEVKDTRDITKEYNNNGFHRWEWWE